GHRGAFVEYFSPRILPPRFLCQPRCARRDLRSRTAGLRAGARSARQRHRGGTGRGPAVRIGGRRPPPAPDAAVIRTLAGLLSETGLTEIDYAVGDTRIRVASESAGTTAPPAPVITNGAAPPQPHAAENSATIGTSHHGTA